MADDIIQIKVKLDDSEAKKQLKALKNDVTVTIKTNAKEEAKKVKEELKAIEQSKIKISSSVDAKEFTAFEQRLKQAQTTNSKINLGLKITNPNEIPALQAKIQKLKADTGNEINLRFNVKQDSNVFNQIKKSIDDVKNDTRTIIAIKFAEVGLGAIKNTINGIKTIASTAFNLSGNALSLIEKGSLFASNVSTANVGLINTIQNQGKSVEESTALAKEIFKATKLFSDKTQLTTQEGIQAATILQNSGYDILKGKDANGSILSAGQNNILNIVADLAARQQAFLGKSSGEAVLDATRALQELQSGSLISLKARFNVGNSQVEKAIDDAGLKNKLEFKVDKKTGEETLVKNSLQNLTTEDLTKFAAAINRVTNSIGLSEVLSRTNQGLVSTIQSKFEDKILQIFGSDQDTKSFNGKLNAVLNNLVGFFDTDASKKLDEQLNVFGSRLGDFVTELARPENISRFGDALVRFGDFSVTFIRSFDPKAFGDGIGKFINSIKDFLSDENKSRFADGLRRFGVTVDTISETISKDGFFGLINPLNNDNVKNRYNQKYIDSVTPEFNSQIDTLGDSGKSIQERINAQIKLNKVLKDGGDILQTTDEVTIANKKSFEDLTSQITIYGKEALNSGTITKQEFDDINRVIRENGGNLDILSQDKFQKVIQKIQESKQNADALGKKLTEITLRDYTLNFDASALRATQQYADSAFASINNLVKNNPVFNQPTATPEFIGPKQKRTAVPALSNADGGRLLKGETSIVNEKGREIFAGSSGKMQLLNGKQFTAPENGVIIPANITAKILGTAKPDIINNYKFTPPSDGYVIPAQASKQLMQNVPQLQPVVNNYHQTNQFNYPGQNPNNQAQYSGDAILSLLNRQYAN